MSICIQKTKQHKSTTDSQVITFFVGGASEEQPLSEFAIFAAGTRFVDHLTGSKGVIYLIYLSFSIYLSIYLSTFLFIYVSIYLSNLSIYLLIYVLIYLSILTIYNQSLYQKKIYHSTYQSIYHSY
jgi:hypothetical protein